MLPRRTITSISVRDIHFYCECNKQKTKRPRPNISGKYFPIQVNKIVLRLNFSSHLKVSLVLLYIICLTMCVSVFELYNNTHSCLHRFLFILF